MLQKWFQVDENDHHPSQSCIIQEISVSKHKLKYSNFHGNVLYLPFREDVHIQRKRGSHDFLTTEGS